MLWWAWRVHLIKESFCQRGQHPIFSPSFTPGVLSSSALWKNKARATTSILGYHPDHVTNILSHVVWMVAQDGSCSMIFVLPKRVCVCVSAHACICDGGPLLSSPSHTITLIKKAYFRK